MRKAEAAKRVKPIRRHIEEAIYESHQSKSPRTARSSEMMTKKRAQQRLWGPMTSELSAHIARWLIHNGLPYTTVVIEDFRLLVEQLTGSPEATILSCHTFNDMLRAGFVRFCEVVMRSLKQEFWLAYKLPFLNLLHDLWTNGTGKKGAIGASISVIDMQRRDQIAFELILFLRFAGDRINFNSFLVYDLEALRSPKPNAKSHSRHRVDTNARSAGAQACVALVKVQVNKRISTTIAETVLILVLDRRTKFSVDSLVRLGACATTAAQEMAGSTSDASEDISNAKFDEFIEERHQWLRDAHREVFSAMHSTALNDREDTTMDVPLNLDLVLSIDDEVVLCVDDILTEWCNYSGKWGNVAVHQAANDKLKADDFTRLLLVCRGDKVCRRFLGLFKQAAIRRWFRETGAALFPSVTALGRVWLGRSPSNTFQERVFLTGGFIMSPLRSSTDNERAEMQALMKQNRIKICRNDIATGSEAIRGDVTFEDGAQSA
ncbi:hypothetical protein PI125_g17917 [Phytophthora idaei]|nr:hypothetical protein PI125_g17917 [Phytophthora idaei]